MSGSRLAELAMRRLKSTAGFGEEQTSKIVEEVLAESQRRAVLPRLGYDELPTENLVCELRDHRRAREVMLREFHDAGAGAGHIAAIAAVLRDRGVDPGEPPSLTNPTMEIAAAQR